MKFELTGMFSAKAREAALLPRPRAAGAELGRICDDVATTAVLAALFLLPVIYSPWADAQWSVPKGALLNSLAVIAVASRLVRLMAGRPVTVRRSPLDIPIAVYLIVALVGVVHAGSREAALLGVNVRADGLLSFVSAVALYFVAYNLPGRSWLLRWAMVAITVSIALSSIEGIAESAGFSLLGYKAGAFGARAYSTTGNPDLLGGNLVLALPMPLALLASSGRRQRALWAGCLSIMLACLVLTYTRGSWIGAGVGMCALLLVGRKEFRQTCRQTWRWWLAGLALAVTLVVLVETGMLDASRLPGFAGAPTAPDAAQQAAPVPGGEGRSVSLINRVQNFGDSAFRLEEWRASLLVALDQPLLGAGYGNLFAAITRYLPAKMSNDNPNMWVDHAHNAFLDQLASLGVPGFLAYLWLMGSFAIALGRHLWKTSPGPRRMLLAALFAAWLGFMAHLFFLFETPDSLGLLWVAMALGLREVDGGKPTTTVALRLPTFMRALLMLAVAFAGVLVIYESAQPVVAEAYVWNARMAIEAGRGEDVLPAFMKAAQVNPNCELLQVRVATSLQRLAESETNLHNRGHFLDEAVRTWSRAILRDPGFAYLYVMRGYAYSQYSTGEHMGDALSDFRTATDLYPNHFEIWALVGDSARALGQTNEAVAADRRSLELKPDDAQGLRFLAMDYVRSARWNEAVAAWEKLVDVQGETVDSRLNIAQSLLMSGNREQGLAELEKARALDPGSQQVEQISKMFEQNGR